MLHKRSSDWLNRRVEASTSPKLVGCNDMHGIDDENTLPEAAATAAAETSPVTSATQATNVEEGESGETLGPGDEIGDYEIQQKIGWGGCSTVYSATHTASGDRVAIKLMHPGLAQSVKQVQRFVQEAEALQVLEHPTIVRVHRVGCTADGRPFIVMELLGGINLASLLHTRGRFSPLEAFEVLSPIVEALGLAHRAGIVHRDIKASNIIIVDSETGREVKLLDFGIAKLVNPGSGSMQTTVGHVLGTPHSMAPEQIRGLKIDGRTDVYALGALLYRLLTGKHPFDGTDALTLTRMHVYTPPPSPSQSAPVSPKIDAVVRRAMEKAPSKRYSDVHSFINALAEAVGKAPVAAKDSARAVAIYVEGRVEAGCDTDDELLDDLMNILDIAERAFQSHALQVPLQTGNAILGALLVASTSSEESVRTRAMDVASEIEQALASRPHADDRIDVNLCLHIDDATIRKAEADSEITGGPIVDVGAWAPQQTMDGVCATRETLGFALDVPGKAARSYIRIGSRRSPTT